MTLPGKFRYCSRMAVKDIISKIKRSTLLPVTLKHAPKFEKLGLAAALLQQCPTSTSESESLAFSSIGKELYLV